MGEVIGEAGVMVRALVTKGEAVLIVEGLTSLLDSEYPITELNHQRREDIKNAIRLGNSILAKFEEKP